MGRISIEKSEKMIVVRSDFWEVKHDLKSGGVISEMRVLYGTGKNLLTKPVSCQIDRWSEHLNQEVKVQLKKDFWGDGFSIKGHLRDLEGEKGPFTYEHTYMYNDYFSRQEIKVTPLRKVVINNLVVSEFHFSGHLDEYTFGTSEVRKSKPRYAQFITHYDDLWGQVREGKINEDEIRPWQVALFKRGVEGFQWTGGSEEYLWNQLGKGNYLLEKKGEDILLRLAPLWKENFSFNEPLTFSSYFILPTVPRHGHKKYYGVFMSTNPFPSDDQLKAWARSGVNFLEIHEGKDWKQETNDFWHMGMWPPYGPDKMKQLREFIKKVHTLGMKIIPYFSEYHLHPESKAFARNGKKWAVYAKENDHLRYDSTSGEWGVFGCLMCHDSGWRRYHARDVRKVLEELDFDGIYSDWNGLFRCFNYNHFPGTHTGTDGLARYFLELRRKLGDKIMVIHSGGQSTWLLHRNIADQIVTLEEGKRDGSCFKFDSLKELPPSVRFMNASDVGIVPVTLFGQTTTGKRLHSGLAQLVLLNSLPYSYDWNEVNAGGYANWKQAISDSRGIYHAYKVFSKFQLEKYRFFDGLSGAVEIEKTKMGGALFAREGEAIVVVSNLSQEDFGGGSGVIKEEIADKYKIVRRFKIPEISGNSFKIYKLNQRKSKRVTF